jgi:peptidyl-prolyl cis-trans isomerase B (cyclophilin B)
MTMKVVKYLLMVPGVALVALLGACETENTDDPADPGSTTTCVYSQAAAASKPALAPSGENVPNTGTVDITLHMTAGDVTMTLDRSNAPCAVNSMESLTTQKFFDNTSCHRMVLNFMLQCGDPTGTSTGGPGYSFADELSGDETYPAGTVAMANAGPNTNGSQFFIVFGDASGLDPNYTILGTVDPDSLAVIQSIADQGIDPDDPGKIKPKEGGRINTATVG